jgi:putative transposase
MALSESAVSELLDVLRTGHAVDLIRETVRMVLQELIETEASDVIGAARYERTDTCTKQLSGELPLMSSRFGHAARSPRFPRTQTGNWETED